MKTQELLQTLELLRQELTQTPEVDEGVRQKLHALMAEIEHGVAGQPGSGASSTPGAASFSQRMLAAMTDFELRHPQLTATLTQLADQLARMGI